MGLMASGWSRCKNKRGLGFGAGRWNTHLILLASCARGEGATLQAAPCCEMRRIVFDSAHPVSVRLAWLDLGPEIVTSLILIKFVWLENAELQGPLSQKVLRRKKRIYGARHHWSWVGDVNLVTVRRGTVKRHKATTIICATGLRLFSFDNCNEAGLLKQKNGRHRS